jgi:hypothetical protein
MVVYTWWCWQICKGEEVFFEEKLWSLAPQHNILKQKESYRKEKKDTGKLAGC